MIMLPKYASVVVGFALTLLFGCNRATTKTEDVTSNVRKSLDWAGLKNVTVTQDRDRGIVNLGGRVSNEAQRAQAEAITTPIALGQVVAVQIAIIPADNEKDAKAINSELDKGIENNLSAALTESKLKNSVKYEVKNALVTLTGEVESEARRTLAEKVAAGIPNVQQVVNTIQIKNQKATSQM